MNSIVEQTAWPPLYTVRRSVKARHASLKISSDQRLEVVLPSRYKLDFAAELVNQKRKWIEKHLRVLPAVNPAPCSLPQEINLALVGEHWKINYLFSPIKTCGIGAANHELIVFGEVDDHAQCLQILRKWVLQKAEQLLIPQLYLLSKELGLNYKSVQIRQQKTRWGSCSSQKKISLNSQMVFLAPELVRHIMIHELCHTRYLNHSKQFWQLVARYDANWQLHRRSCRQAEKVVPYWLNSGRANSVAGC